MAMVRLYSESLVCLPDGFLTLTGSLPWVGLTCMVDLMSEQQMFTARWKGSISDQVSALQYKLKSHIKNNIV